MLFLGHLLIGLILGFMLYEFFKDKNIIVFCALGSILPDLIDKPLGHIILSSSLDNGKIYFHSLIILVFLCITGIFVWKYYRSSSFLFVSLGVLVHQILDLMWKHPQNWYYPLLGPYQNEVHPDYIRQIILTELSSSSEWIFFAAIVVIICLIIVNISWHKDVPALDPIIQQKKHQLYGGLIGVAFFVLILSVIIIYIWQPLFND